MHPRAILALLVLSSAIASILAGAVPPPPARAAALPSRGARLTPPADTTRADSIGADSIERRIRVLLASDSLDLDSLARLLREDSLAANRRMRADSARARADTSGAPRRLSDTTAARPRPAIAAPRAMTALPPRDSTAIRWEAGASTDLIDEQFYEYRDEVFDTLSRKVVSEPEARYAGVVAVAFDGVRARGRVRWQLHDETSVGDLLQRTTLDGVWRDDRSPRWKLLALPWLDLRHDRTFGRDLDEWHGAGTFRVRRLFDPDGDQDVELGVRGELLHTSGSGTDFLLSRNAATVSAAFDRSPLLGDELRAGYSFTVREFPDSSVRDHLEHGWEAHWRHLLPAGWIGIETDGERRGTLNEAPTTRDNFWRGRAEADLEAPLGRRGWLQARLEGEALRYDAPDTLVYFDENLARLTLLPGVRGVPGRSLAIGPRIERLWSPGQPGEPYLEAGGVAELEWISGRSLWTAMPAVGRRTYDRPLAGAPLQQLGLHSSYVFYDLSLIADQRLAGSLRLRGLLDGRIESHTVPADDSRSLYFSLDLRMLF